MEELGEDEEVEGAEAKEGEEVNEDEDEDEEVEEIGDDYYYEDEYDEVVEVGEDEDDEVEEVGDDYYYEDDEDDDDTIIGPQVSHTHLHPHHHRSDDDDDDDDDDDLVIEVAVVPTAPFFLLDLLQACEEETAGTAAAIASQEGHSHTRILHWPGTSEYGDDDGGGEEEMNEEEEVEGESTSPWPQDENGGGGYDRRSRHPSYAPQQRHYSSDASRLLQGHPRLVEELQSPSLDGEPRKCPTHAA